MSAQNILIMRGRREAEWEASAAVPATLQASDEVSRDFREQLRSMLTRAQASCAELLLREALTNAVVHGCAKDASKQVRCKIRLRAGRLTIAIADEGKGFDWRAASERCVPEQETSGRGIQILRTYSSRVRFNQQGNSVTILKHFHPEDSFHG